MLTCDPDIGADLTQLFNFLTGYARDVEYRKLLVAPHDLRPRIAELIEQRGRRRGRRAGIVFKMNSLVDAEMIDVALRRVAGRRARST